MFNVSHTTLVVFACAFVATLVLAAWFTPARWWRQPNVIALSVVVLGTWGLGSLALWLLDTPARAPQMATAPSTHGVAGLSATSGASGVSYRVREDLNLRAGTGTGARRIAIVPAGTVVTTTGARDGDWWQVQASIDGRAVKGWSSSLWLRRADEARHYQ